MKDHKSGCKILFFVLATLLMVLGPAEAQGPQDVSEVRLDNGLKIIMREVKGVPLISLGCWYRVGSKDENAGTTGISHFVEHMSFRGTRNWPGERFQQAIRELGGNLEGFTSLDQTAFLTTVPNTQLEALLKLEAERMTQSQFEPALVENERQILISEWLRGANHPQNALDMEVSATAIRVHPYRWPASGWVEDLKQTSREQLYNHYLQFYAPSNAVLVLVGDFQTPQALALIRKHFERLPRRPDPARPSLVEPAARGERRVKLVVEGETPLVEIAFRSPDILNDEFYAILLMDASLTGARMLDPRGRPEQDSAARSSRLYKALVDRRLVTRVSSNLTPTQHPYLYKLTLTLPDPFQFQSVEEAVFEELEKMKNYGMTSYELSKARNQLVAQAFLDQDSISRLGHQLGLFESIASHKLIQNLEEKISNVTNDDLRRVAGKYFVENSRTVGWFVPVPRQRKVEVEKLSRLPDHYRESNFLLRPAFDNPEGNEYLSDIAKAKTGSAFPQGQPAIDKPGTDTSASGELVIPRVTLLPEKRTLTNGLMVIAVENNASPTVTIEVNVKAGSMRERDESSGLAHLVGRMLERGTRSKNISQVAEGFDFLGAQLRTDTDYLTTTMIIKGLSKDAGSLIQQLAEILQSPAFSPQEFEKARAESLARLREESDDSQLRAELALRERIYPVGHPFSRPPGGSIKTIEKLKLPDLTAFYKRFYRPDQVSISVAGGIQPDRVFQMVESSFGKWTVAGSPESFSIPEARPGLGKGQQVVRMSDKPQCDLAFGYPAVSIKNPDYYPMLVIIQILGQSGADGRLGIRLRDQEGLASYARVSLDASLSEGPLIIRAGTSADQVDRVIGIIQEEIAEIKAQGVTNQELAAAKQRLINSFPVKLESNEGIARQLLKTELFGLGEDYFNRFSILVGGVTMGQITDCLRTYFPLDQAALVVAGPYPPK